MSEGTLRAFVAASSLAAPAATSVARLRGAACNAGGEVFFCDTAANKVFRIALDGSIHLFLADSGHANSLTFGPQGELYAVSSATGKVLRYDAAGKASLVAEGLPGQYLLATPGGGLYVTVNPAQRNGDKASGSGEVWYIKDGKKRRVANGLKFATGLAYRPDRWLLAVAEGRSKWATSYQIAPDGGLMNGERFFWLHVADGEDDTGAEEVCYAREGPILIGTRMGIQVCADDGPTQGILPLPDHSRVVGLCFGGRDRDTLYAFSGNRIWKRRVKIHGIGAFTPWIKVNGTPL